VVSSTGSSPSLKVQLEHGKSASSMRLPIVSNAVMRTAADLQFRERFAREAARFRSCRVRIFALCGTGEQQGTAFLVMEYLEARRLSIG
jgi:hypothetical protein